MHTIMYLKKPFISLLAACCILLFISATDKTPVMIKWVILKDCTVKVNGSTNINKFSCSIPDYLRSDTLICYRPGNEIPVALTGRLALPVISFDCGNNMMTNDLRKTLKAKEFPSLHIYFISLERYPELNNNQESITGIVNIELAGVSKRIEINYMISMDEHKIIHLVGTQTIRFSDFALIPPRKLGGMIRADDKLDVVFKVNFKRISDP